MCNFSFLRWLQSSILDNYDKLITKSFRDPGLRIFGFFRTGPLVCAFKSRNNIYIYSYIYITM